MEQSLHLMNPWWEGKEFETGLARNKYLKELIELQDKKEIIFLTGLRRIGKTTILKQIIKDLIQKVDSRRILYLTLDFISFKGKTIHELVQEFRKIHEHKVSEKIFLFLDEITQIPEFEKELKNLYDLENVKIYASSSSASLMKSKNSFLVGRSRIIEILPLDFEEFLAFKNIKVSEQDKHLMDKNFEDYLRIGGLPEYVLTEDISYVKNTIEQIMYKDIIAFHDIKDKDSVEKLFLLFCERVGKRLTYAKVARILSISVDTVRRYTDYFKEVFLFFTIEKHAKSLNERIFSPKKLYIADIGIRNVFVGFKDKGALFENVVFLKIKDKNPHYFYENEKEIDFIVGETALEVKYKEQIEKKEIDFFEKSDFKKKILIQSFEDLKKLEGNWEKKKTFK
ncbi:ATP-binding protein [Candidatus Woesearchaeota archaeon]|nr:ATP-binding protein [Candidatus Woesearchaeota archaeon]